MPVFALAVVACTPAGFAVTSVAGVNPVWAALAGAAVLAGRALAQRRTTPAAIVTAANVPFVFVLAPGVVVRAVVDSGLGGALRHLVPGGVSLPSLLGTAALAAALANVINNLPAVLVLLPLAVPAGSGAVLAVLLGVNIGRARQSLPSRPRLPTPRSGRNSSATRAGVDMPETTRPPAGKPH